MCGIAGYFGKKDISKSKIKKTLLLMKKRGPDFQSYYKNKINSKNIILLHSRLSIIDLKNKKANQPYKYKNLLIVFNGEIYNYIELKNILLKNNYEFETTSDTEVLLKFYHFKGTKAFDYFEGMWSIAIFDLKKKDLLLSRDRFGEKPLYFKKEKSGIYFASETKFIQSLYNKKLYPDFNKCNEYLYYGYNSINKSENSFIKDINIFQPSYNFKISYENKIIKKKYWDLKNLLITSKKKSFREVTKNIKKAFINSLKIRLRSDVKLGSFLSSGIDSNSIYFFTKKIFNQKLETYSLFDKKNHFYDESKIVKKLNKTNKIKNFNKDVLNLNLEKYLKKTTHYYNSPTLTLNSILINSLYEKVHSRKVRVMLSGVGSDEIFAGYFDHFRHHILDTDNKKYKKKNYSDFKKIRNYIKNKSYVNLDNKKFNFSRLENMQLFKRYFKKIPKSYKSKPKKIFSSRLKNVLYLQFEENLYPTLYAEDLNSMMNSVESRTPFLDRKLVEEVFKSPSQYFMNKGFNKFLLRHIGKNIVPNFVLNKINKQGFNSSLSSVKMITNKHFIKLLSKKHMKKFFNKKILNFINQVDINNLSHQNNQFLFRILSVNSFLINYYKK